MNRRKKKAASTFGEFKACKRCSAAFYPLDRERELCIRCYQQQKADANYTRLAFGKEFK